MKFTVKATKAAKSIIAHLRNSFRYFDAVRPHLEYAVPVWNANLKKDIDMLENVNGLDSVEWKNNLVK